MTHILLNLMLCLSPAGYAVLGLWGGRQARQRRWLRHWASLSLLAALPAGGALLTGHLPSPWFSAHPASALMLILVSFLATVVIRYSDAYLDGEPGLASYYRWLPLTIAAVLVTVTSNHGLVLLAAWAMISLSLHHLLCFYPERPRAVLAAAKKFFSARLAEMALLFAFVSLYRSTGSWWIADWTQHFQTAATLPLSEQAAVLAIAVAALVKCAQMPLHGWLIKVVESPTPVSALLHAGIVNLGGYLLILTAPMLVRVPLASGLVLVLAGLGALVAALVTRTRISIKVMLAWSTCAQMGWMLVECALGYFDLAMLHLLAHSAYKAYAFLNAGSEVQASLGQDEIPSPTWRDVTLAGLLALAASVLGHRGFVVFGMPIEASAVMLWAAALSLPLAESLAARRPVGTLALLAVGLLVMFLGQAQRLGLQALGLFHDIPDAGADYVIAALLLVMASVYWWLRLGARHRPEQWLYRHLYHGFYLDERISRWVVNLLPARFLEIHPAASALPQEIRE